MHFLAFYFCPTFNWIWKLTFCKGFFLTFPKLSLYGNFVVIILILNLPLFPPWLLIISSSFLILLVACVAHEACFIHTFLIIQSYVEIDSFEMNMNCYIIMQYFELMTKGLEIVSFIKCYILQNFKNDSEGVVFVSVQAVKFKEILLTSLRV